MQALLTLNAGSSSIKFRLYALGGALPFLLGGKVTDIGGAPVFQVHEEEHSRDDLHPLPVGTTHADALEHILGWLEARRDRWQLAAAAHRVVHGGTRYTRATRLDDAALTKLLAKAEAHLGKPAPLTEDGKAALMAMADGDGRYFLNLVEEVFAWGRTQPIDANGLMAALQKRAPAYDKDREEHYNLISAWHKATRGSDPDAALYWFARMLEGGEDPRRFGRHQAAHQAARRTEHPGFHLGPQWRA